MMAGNYTKIQRNYLAKDFSDLRADLTRYAQTFFPDKIKDFSEAGLGGMFIDLAASVGDTMSYYLDHQFNELSWSDSVELGNIERHLRNAGVKITGASPATVTLTFFIEVPAISTTSGYVPDETAIPILLAGTVSTSVNRVNFTLMDDIDFNERDRDNFLKATVNIGETDDFGNPLTFVLSKEGVATSSTRTSENFSVPDGYNPFFSVNLANSNVSRIVSVTDSEGNSYYEVDSLTQDMVYTQVTNYSYDNQEVNENLALMPAPRRFTSSTNISTRTTTLTFGGGDNAQDAKTTLDPSSIALPLYGKTAITRYSLDPNSLLKSKTLGIAPSNTTLTVQYEYGGGINHNIAAKSIRSVSKVAMTFPGFPGNTVSLAVRSSIDVINYGNASGGTNQPTIQDLRLQIPSARNSQLRVVTKQDLIARVYSLPTKFGKVSKVGCRSNPSNPLSKQLYILGLDSNGKLAQASDTLKMNIRNYLNDMRLISDAIDIVDSPIINFRIKASIVIKPGAVSIEVIQNVIQSIKNELQTPNFQIDQPLIIADLQYAIINTPGVLSLINLEITNVSGNSSGNEYSDYVYDIDAATSRGIIIAPQGGIFELKYPDSDIIVISS